MELLLTLAKQFKINESFFVMLGIFVAAYWLLRVLGLKKLSESIVERDRRIDGRRHESQALAAENEQIQAKLSDAMAQVRAEASKLFSEFRGRAQQEQRQILNLAREKAGAQIKEANREALRQLSEESSKVTQESDRLAQLVLDRLLISGGGSGGSKSQRSGMESGL